MWKIDIDIDIENDGASPDDCKKSNIESVHKKDLKNMLINNRPISLLQIFAKIIEKITFTLMLDHFIENENWTSQLLNVIHEIQ